MISRSEAIDSSWPVEWPVWKIRLCWFVAAVLATFLLLGVVGLTVEIVGPNGSLDDLNDWFALSLMVTGFTIALAGVCNIRVRRNAPPLVDWTAASPDRGPEIAIRSAISVTKLFPMAVATLVILDGFLGVATLGGVESLGSIFLTLFWFSWIVGGMLGLWNTSRITDPEFMFTKQNLWVRNTMVRWSEIEDIRPILRGAYPIVELLVDRESGSNCGTQIRVEVHPVRYHVDSEAMLVAIENLCDDEDTRIAALSSPVVATELFARFGRFTFGENENGSDR
ncbi:hypothetical protein TSST111916_06670 [Tsukamurella strandjordii]